jgi:hypothetical protein
MAQMTVTQFTVARIKAFKDSKGNPAKVDGVPEWATDSPEVLSLEPAADGMTCKVTALGLITSADVPARVQVTADADLGAGVKPIIGVLEFDVTPGEAVTVQLETEPAQEQPAA